MKNNAYTLNYHQDPHVLHVGTEKPHAYFIPFESEEAVRTCEREKSAYFTSLVGEWRFRHYPSLSALACNEEENDGIAYTETISVPSSWQVLLSRGYDAPEYHDTDYPFMVEPPYVPIQNPVGVYEKDIYILAEDLKSKNPHLVFEGVDSCFYLYVNDTLVGYSQVSHSTSEFSVGAYLREGKNQIKVLVLKWCDGSYLEDQDKIRLSGIFREVYLLWRDKIGIRDIFVRTLLNDTFDFATVKAEISLNGKASLSYRFLDPTGECVREGKAVQADSMLLEIPVEKPYLWSDEAPFLYELVMHVGEEYIRELVGIRRFEVKGRLLLVNGKAVKGKGVNRHDSHPELGAATPKEHILRDLYIMKAHNVNMVRTAHYPNDPRFLEYCDRLGFYVCNEADLEAHGMDYTEGFGRNTLSDDPEWTEAYVDRAVLLLERDKNHASVLLWSIGNESGIGQNHKHMADYLHSRMPEAIVHSERYNYIEHLLRQKEPTVDGFERYLTEPYMDIDSRMYATPEDCLENYVESKTATRPFFLCEYCHAMGNGPGDLSRYWDIIWNHDCFFGGCVWEFADHTVNAGAENAPRYLYGGDFGEKIHEANFCMDGLVYPDRRVHSGLLEYRQILSPVIASSFDKETGAVTLKSRRYFTSLSDVELYYTVEDDGVLVCDGLIEKLDIAPGEKGVYALPISDVSLSGNAYLTLYFRENKEKAWAEAHHLISTAQFLLHSTAPSLPAVKTTGALSLNESNSAFSVTDGNACYRIDKETGELFSLNVNGKELLSSPLSFALWRAPTDNDRIVRKEWERLGYDRMKRDCRALTLDTNEKDKIVVAAHMRIGADAQPVFAHLSLVYTFEVGKGVCVRSEISLKDKPKQTLPRLGLGFTMPERFEALRYFGKGPVESYEDKNLAARTSLFESTVGKHFEHYLKPQENMAHTGTMWVTLLDEEGEGLGVYGTSQTPSFSFNASHYTPMDLTLAAHDFELVPKRETVVQIDYKQAGIGSNSCGPTLAKEVSLLEQEYSYSFRIVPIIK